MKRKNLPSCMYFKHGAYYLIKQNKWVNLGRDYIHAMAEYARLTTAALGVNEVAYLVRITIDGKEKDLAANTVKQYRLCESKIAEAFQNFEARQVKPKHIMAFMEHHADKPNMANRMLSVLRMSFDKGVLLDMCDNNPTLSVKRHSEKKRDTLMTEKQFIALKSYPNPVVSCVLDLCYLTAQRIGDVLKIKLSDISVEGIEIIQQKTGKRILVQMNPALKDAITSAKEIHPKYLTPIYLLAQKNGKKRSYYAFKDMFDRARTHSGVSGVTIHDIRAMALTRADKLGIDATRLAGHGNEAQTQTYLRDKTPQIVVGLPKNVK